MLCDQDSQSVSPCLLKCTDSTHFGEGFVVRSSGFFDGITTLMLCGKTPVVLTEILRRLEKEIVPSLQNSKYSLPSAMAFLSQIFSEYSYFPNHYSGLFSSLGLVKALWFYRMAFGLFGYGLPGSRVVTKLYLRYTTYHTFLPLL